MKKKVVITGVVAILAIIIIFLVENIISNSSKSKKIQDQLQLGQKYLDELQYDQALVAYMEVLSIDKKNMEALTKIVATYSEMASVGMDKEYVEQLEMYQQSINYAELAREYYPDSEGVLIMTIHAYMDAGDFCMKNLDYDKAKEYYRAIDKLPEYSEAVTSLKMEAKEKYDSIEEVINKLEDEKKLEEVGKIIAGLNITFSIDQVVLGITDMSEVKGTYMSREYVYSNLMDNESVEGNQDDAVYTCYGMNNTPIPDGNEEDEFGFLFVSASSGGPIYDMGVHDKDLLCGNSFYVGDSLDKVFTFFELNMLEDTIMNQLTDTKSWKTDNGKELEITKAENDIYVFQYKDGNKNMYISVINERVYFFGLSLIEH